MSKNDYNFHIYFVKLYTYIIPNAVNNVLIQGDSVFYIVPCH